MDVTKKSGYVLFTNSMYGEKLGNELWDYLEKENPTKKFQEKSYRN
jgi:hypothetical protein